MDNNNPSWDDYFYGIAKAVEKKAKDGTSVGAVIVKNDGNIILSTGYNGFPRGVEENSKRADNSKNEDGTKEKYKWTCHAETNAIYNAVRIGVSVDNASIYTTKRPCSNCSIAIVQSGIKRVYTKDISESWDGDNHDPDGKLAATILKEGGVDLQIIEPRYFESDDGGDNTQSPINHH
ncbi:MAG: hypothetical protein DSZ28_01670 [Thiothrix sp.]|nr:MAG: hypothetical protein DSZ28_01670 [Thiothrix sp.]